MKRPKKSPSPRLVPLPDDTAFRSRFFRRQLRSAVELAIDGAQLLALEALADAELPPSRDFNFKPKRVRLRMIATERAYRRDMARHRVRSARSVPAAWIDLDNGAEPRALKVWGPGPHVAAKFTSQPFGGVTVTKCRMYAFNPRGRLVAKIEVAAGNARLIEILFKALQRGIEGGTETEIGDG